jgi:hypothetical protein
MPVSSANLKFYLSGGSGNTNPNACLGDARSTTPVAGTINNLFDDVTGSESTAGSTEYRCLYFRNEDADANGLINPIAWISSNTPSATTTMAIGLDPAGKNGTATTIVNELAAPAGVTFTSPSTKGTGLALPSGPYTQNDYVAIWFKRVVDALTSSATTDPSTLRVEGDTV